MSFTRTGSQKSGMTWVDIIPLFSFHMGCASSGYTKAVLYGSLKKTGRTNTGPQPEPCTGHFSDEQSSAQACSVANNLLARTTTDRG